MSRNINLKALRVAYNQYFNGIEAVTDVVLLSMHFKLGELVSLNEDVLKWEDVRLSDFSIWQPFADTVPSKVYGYLLASYEDITSTLGLDENSIVIDKLKVASMLAHNGIVAEFKNTQTKYEYADSSTGEAVYTQVAQELYDEFFNYYLYHLEELENV